MTYNILRLCGVLYFHFYWGLFLIFFGAFAVLTRFIDKLRPYHHIFGRLWCYGMVYQISTSLYVRNDGFKWFTFLFLMSLVTFMSVGQFAIRTYQRNLSSITKNNRTSIKDRLTKPHLDQTSSLSVSATEDMHLNNRASKTVQKNNNRILTKEPLTKPHHLPTSSLSVSAAGDIRLNNPASESVQKNNGSPDNSLHESRLKVLNNQLFLKRLHATMMILALLFTTGAGIMFTRRSKHLKECINLYSGEDTMVPGSVVFERDGAYWVGGHNFTPPLR